MWKRIRWFAWRMGRALKQLAWAFTIDASYGWVWLGWVLACVAAAVGFVYLISGSPVSPSGLLEDQVRVTGLFLELLGIWTIANGLRDRAKHYGKSGPLAPIGDRLRTAGKEFASAFLGPPRTVAVGGSVAATSAFAVGLGKVHKGLPPGASMEERIARLEGRADELQEQADELERQLEEKHKEMLGALKEERQAREADTAAVRKKVAQVDTGGLHIEWMGVWWLLFGVTLATLSPELAGLWYAL